MTIMPSPCNAPKGLRCAIHHFSQKNHDLFLMPTCSYNDLQIIVTTQLCFTQCLVMIVIITHMFHFFTQKQDPFWRDFFLPSLCALHAILFMFCDFLKKVISFKAAAASKVHWHFPWEKCKWEQIPIILSLLLQSSIRVKRVVANDNGLVVGRASNITQANWLEFCKNDQRQNWEIGETVKLHIDQRKMCCQRNGRVHTMCAGE